MDIHQFGKNDDDKKIDKNVEINIYYQKRNNRKSWTIIEGIKDKKMISILRKTFSCSSSMDDKGIITMSGTHKEELCQFLIKQGYKKENIKIN